MNKKTSLDFLVNANAEKNRKLFDTPEPIRPDARRYGDAELYRIVVSLALHEGRFNSKSEFDDAVRSVGRTVEEADETIAWTSVRPGCMAYRVGKSMACDCGARWVVGDHDLPACNKR